MRKQLWRYTNLLHLNHSNQALVIKAKRWNGSRRRTTKELQYRAKVLKILGKYVNIVTFHELLYPEDCMKGLILEEALNSDSQQRTDENREHIEEKQKLMWC